MIYLTDEAGNQVMKHGEPIVMQYQRYFPETINSEVIFAILIALVGIVSIWVIEKAASQKTEA